MTSNVRPFQQSRGIDGGDMGAAAGITSQVIDCKYINQVRWQLNYTVTGVPVGAWSVQVCETNLAADFKDFPLTSAMVKIISGDGALASGVVDINGVGAGRIDFNLVDVYGFLQLAYTFGSAGTGALATATCGAK